MPERRFCSLVGFQGGHAAEQALLVRMSKMRVCAIPTQPRPRLLFTWKLFVYQFMLVKPGLSLTRCVLILLNDIAEEPMSDERASTIYANLKYASIASLVVAMFGLLNIYRTFSDALRPYKVRASGLPRAASMLICALLQSCRLA